MKKYFCPFVGYDFYITESDGEVRFASEDDLKADFVEKNDFIKVSETAEAQYVATEISAEETPFVHAEAFRLTDIRSFYLAASESDFAVAVRARQFAHFQSHSRFCPKCGVRTNYLAFNAMKCPKCGYEIYPTISPACIVLVKKGDEILMVRSLTFKTKMYGLVAGFLEAGESLEQCIERELMEETSLKVKNIRYFGSQPWPFPSTEMIGFIADYAEGEIRLQAEELSAGEFFSRDNLPELPHKMSFARKMVDASLRGEV